MARVTTLTSKGQVTIPKAIRDELGLKPRDEVEIFIKDGDVWLRKADSSLQDLAGSLPPIGLDIEEAIERAKEERAQALVEKLKRS